MIKNSVIHMALLFPVLFLLIPGPLHAHGVKGTIDRGGICITAQYNTNEAMSYAKVTIRPPGKGLDFQTGRTDRNGRFCFFPDKPGDWEVIVDDGMGHRLKLVVPIDPKNPAMGEKPIGPSTKNTLSKLLKALMGLCVIFGISGCLLWWMSKKRDKKGRDHKIKT